MEGQKALQPEVPGGVRRAVSLGGRQGEGFPGREGQHQPEAARIPGLWLQRGGETLRVQWSFFLFKKDQRSPRKCRGAGAGDDRTKGRGGGRGG